MNNKRIQTLSLAVGAAFVGSLALSADASANAFSVTDLDRGYQLVGDKEGTCGEGKCGKKDAEGKCGGDKKEGEGKCGKEHAEGKCGGDKKEGEGKCGGAV